MKNDILFFLFQNISVLFKYANCLFLIFSNNRWQYNNVSSIRVNLIYNVCHNLQFFVYKIFSFVWIVISTDMANNQLFRKLDDNVNFMFFHLENNVLYFFFFFFLFLQSFATLNPANIESPAKRGAPSFHSLYFKTVIFYLSILLSSICCFTFLRFIFFLSALGGLYCCFYCIVYVVICCSYCYN